MSVKRIVASTRSELGRPGEARDEALGRLHRRAVGLVVDPRVDASELRQLGDLGASDPRGGVVAGARERTAAG